MPQKWTGSWKGGRYYLDAEGRPVFVIERRHRGERHVVRLATHDPELAVGELARYLQDPATYHRAARTSVADPATITAESIKDYLRSHERQKGWSATHYASNERYLTAWGNALKGRDLRDVRGRDLLRILGEWTTARPLRIAAIKHYYGWLIRTQVLDAAQNASAALVSEKGAAKKRAGRRVGYPAAEIEAAYAHTPWQAARDVFVLQAKCGMHHTEVVRLAARGRIREVDAGEIAAVVEYQHKSGQHRQSVDAQVLAALRRLQTRKRQGRVGAPAKDTCLAAAKLAAAARGPKAPIVYHEELRHSFVTLARERGRMVYPPGEQGLPWTEVAKAVGHRSGLMIATHYDDSAVPPMVVVPLRLHHPDDPAA